MKDVQKRLENERAHAAYLLSNKAGEIWGWETPAGRVRAARRLKYFIELGRLGPGKKVLEVGCGTGIFTRGLVATKAQITSIDIAPALVDYAKKHTSVKNVSFEVQDAMNTSYENESFDVVIGCSILHHLEPELALCEFFRLLKKGGRIVFSEPNMLNPQIALQKNIPAIKRWVGDSPDETAFFSWQVKRLFKKHGFSSVMVQPFDFLHPATPKPFIGVVKTMGELFEHVPLVKNIAGSLIMCAQK